MECGRNWLSSILFSWNPKKCALYPPSFDWAIAFVKNSSPELYHTHLSALIPVWHIQHFPGRSARTQLLSHLSSPSQCTGKQRYEVFSASVMVFVHLKLPSGFSLNLSFQFSCSFFWRCSKPDLLPSFPRHWLGAFFTGGNGTWHNHMHRVKL